MQAKRSGESAHLSFVDSTLAPNASCSRRRVVRCPCACCVAAHTVEIVRRFPDSDSASRTPATVPTSAMAPWALRTGTTVPQLVDRSPSGVPGSSADQDAATESARALSDHVINRLFSSGLAVASILSRQGVDQEVRDRLWRVIHELDGAIVELRMAALAATDAQRGLRADLNSRRWFGRFIDDQVFAHAHRGHDFYCARDHTSWARERDGVVVPAAVYDETQHAAPRSVRRPGIPPIANPVFDEIAPEPTGVFA